MTNQQLKKEFFRLSSCSSIRDCKEMLDIYSEFFVMGVQSHHDEPVYTQADKDAKIVFQMNLTKVLHLKSAIEGISYQTKDGSRLNEIIDPTIVAILIRNIYETAAMFNLIYRDAKSKEQRDMLYLLWVHSGLKYRQRFGNVITTEENREKQEHEQSQIDSIVKEIQGSELYKSLDDKNQEKIRKKLKDKDYLMRFDGAEVVFLHWHKLTEVMGIKEGLLDHIYSYFSLYSHPSNVAVFQFAGMFEHDEAYLRMVIFNLKSAFIVLSVFIADYIKLFPDYLSTYERLEPKEQIAINFYNIFARGQDYSINDSFKIME